MQKSAPKSAKAKSFLLLQSPLLRRYNGKKPKGCQAMELIAKQMRASFVKPENFYFES